MSSQQRNNRVVDLRNRVPARERKAPEPRPARIEREGQGARVSSLRVRRKRRRFVIAGIVIVLLIGLAAGIHYASYSRRVTIQSIDVRGAQTVSSQEIHDLVARELSTPGFRYISERNIFTYPRVKIQNDIVAAYPRVRSAVISRESLLSTAVSVVISERTVFAHWCDVAGACYAMDETGFIFADAASAPEAPSSAYVFSGGLASTSPIVGQIFAPGHLPGILALLKYLGNADHPALGAQIADDEDFQVQLQAGYYLKASFGEDANLLVKNLELVLQSDALQGKEGELEYVDLRFGNRVYYKLKGQDQSPAQ